MDFAVILIPFFILFVVVGSFSLFKPELFWKSTEKIEVRGRKFKTVKKVYNIFARLRRNISCRCRGGSCFRNRISDNQCLTVKLKSKI